MGDMVPIHDDDDNSDEHDEGDTEEMKLKKQISKISRTMNNLIPNVRKTDNSHLFIKIVKISVIENQHVCDHDY